MSIRTALAELAEQTWDVAIIGAGAVGCAAARELAARGYHTLLLDRGDIGAGTSSRSSRTLYCGVGYLAPRFAWWKIPLHPIEMWQRFAYTRNIMHCRAELVREMPQRLSKHRFYYPFRPKDQYPHWLIDAGFRLMEWAGSQGISLNWRKDSADHARQHSALVAGIGGEVAAVGGVDEYMYQWPERICVDTALDAELRGARIRTYTKVERLQYQGQYWQLELSDQADAPGKHIQIKARAVVNAAGPWVDRIAGGRGDHSTRRVIGKKGVNVMVRLPDAWRGQGLEAFSSKGEPFYVFPWGEHHFIGPTELETDENPDSVRVLGSEVEYILGEMNWLFPQLNLGRRDVLYAWCGVRPMSSADGRTIALPVRAVVQPALPHLVTVTGAYIMMHRHAARLAAKRIETMLGKQGLAPQGMLHQPRTTDHDEGIAEIARHEHVVHLSDLLRRRLADGLNANLGLDRADAISHIAAEALGWNEVRRLEEVERFKKETSDIFQRME